MSADEHRDGGRQSDLAVMEASEYKQKRRLREILDAHDDVEEMISVAYGEYASGNISHDGKNIRILKAVQRYIREAHGVILEYLEERRESELRRKEREGEDFEPRVEPYWNGNGEQPLGAIEMETGDHVVFYGLRDVLFADELYTETWEEALTTRNGPNRMVTRSASHTVPESVSIRAYLLLNEFLSTERDIVGINFSDDDLPTWGFLEVEESEYRDTAEIARERMENGDGGGDE